MSVDEDVEVLHSMSWHNGMITGAAFCGSTGMDIVVSAYDWDELRIIQAV